MIISKNLYKAGYLTVFILALAIAAWRMPAYASRMPWLLTMAIADLYLFWHLSSGGIINKPWLRKVLVFITGLPSALLMLFFLSLAFLSPVDWNPILRTYLLGFVVFFYLIRLMPLLVLILFDLRKSITQLARKSFHLANKRVWLKISAVFSAILGIAMIMGMTLWVYDFEIIEEEIHIENLPTAFEGYRIVQLSDIHLGRWHSQKPLQKAVEMVNSLDADLIAFTGDLVNYATSEALPFTETLSSLSAKDGVFAVLGNHDYGDYMRWPNAHAKEMNDTLMNNVIKGMGWFLLENRNVKLFRDKQCIVVAGTGNYSDNEHYPDRSDVRLSLAGIPDSCKVILLTHTPSIIGPELLQKQHVDLILSGHTHGLQLGLKVGKRKYSPASIIYQYWGGLFSIENNGQGKSYIYVNRGLGHIFFPFRIGMKPEITLLTLKSMKE
ncbi:MAG: metallophosphoesterase [Bacteroidales bacterium]|nr:metallophosphoesterase [Bacteroidales bacterium]